MCNVTESPFWEIRSHNNTLPEPASGIRNNQLTKMIYLGKSTIPHKKARSNRHYRFCLLFCTGITLIMRFFANDGIGHSMKDDAAHIALLPRSGARQSVTKHARLTAPTRATSGNIPGHDFRGGQDSDPSICALYPPDRFGLPPVFSAHGTTSPLW